MFSNIPYVRDTGVRDLHLYEECTLLIVTVMHTRMQLIQA